MWIILIALAAMAALGVALGALVWRRQTRPRRPVAPEPAPFVMRPPHGWENLSGAEYEEAEVERIEENFALDDYDRMFGDEAYSRAEARER